MKKIFPYTLVLATLFLIFLGQASLNLINGQAGLTSEINKNDVRLNSVFKEMNLPDISGKIIKLNKLEAPIIIVNFWASWCVPCLEEMPSLNELQKKFSPSQVKIISVNNEETGSDQNEEVKRILARFKVSYDVVLDRDGSIFEAFNVSSVPQTIMFKRGKVFHVLHGTQNFNDRNFVQTVQGMLQEKEENM